jgi:hypothetical protein
MDGTWGTDQNPEKHSSALGYSGGAVGRVSARPSGRWPANLVLGCTCAETREGVAKSGTHVGHNRDGAALTSQTAFHARHKDTNDVGYGDASGHEPTRIHTDPDCPCAMLDAQTGERRSAGDYPTTYSNATGYGGWQTTQGPLYNDSGGASRFFYRAPIDDPDAELERFRYVAKASRRERNAGCEGMPEHDKADQSSWGRTCNVCGATFVDPATGEPKCGHGDFSWTPTKPAANHHPTVKPVALMRWLIKLVAYPGDLVLDPFMGSGTTGVACAMEGREFIGIEREAEYVAIAERRIAAAAEAQLDLLS